MITEMLPPRLPPNHSDVVIVGGGLAGLTIAKALADGLGPRARITLIARDEPARSAAAESRSFALGAASVRMLTKLGVWTACEPRSQAVTGIDITDSSLRAGLRPILLSYDNVVGSDEPASYIVPNSVLEAALRASVAATPQIVRVSSHDGIGFTASPNGVEIKAQPDTALSAKILIAADGGKSPLREMAGIQTTGWSYGQTGITVTIAHDRPHGGRAIQHFLPGGPFALLPLPGNRTCVTWSESDAEARRVMALDDAAFLAELEQRAGGRLGAIRLDGPRQSWPLAAFVARTFIAPRFALVGDAAHNVHPIAGQGLNLGLRDCAALAECIVDAYRLGLDIGEAPVLQRYDRWRRFDTLTAAASYDALNRLFSDDGRVRRSLREFGLGLVNRLPGVKQRLVAEAAGLTGDLPRLLRGDAV
jgi:2-octaprenyl-6-methoxyphenol hydroxylase